ncbi:MAG: hypothetical protein CMJ46_05285 [Planctomyces sp.]|nr:hypothetical protein [Planctomyces sp.]
MRASRLSKQEVSFSRPRLIAAMLCAGVIASGVVLMSAVAEEPHERNSPTAWTFDEALTALRLYPHDPYLQYVVLQLGRRDALGREAERELSRLLPPGRNQFGRTGDLDLFSIFSGASAVQESLQLDTMRGDRAEMQNDAPWRDNPEFERSRPRNREAEQKRLAEPVPVTELEGPTIQSHPWREMLAGRKPEVSTLARAVPEDFYFVRFRSLGKLLEVMDSTDLWGTHLASQATQEATTDLVGERLRKQLAIETNQLLEPFYDVVVDEVAVTGSDLYYREGSDITLLFRFRQPLIFKTRMNGFLDAAAAGESSITRESGEYLGVPYDQLTSPDRKVNVYSAYPASDLHVRSNSLVGLKRVIAAMRGQDENGAPVRRLGETDEFAYIRTLLPLGAEDEDGLVYLSDPFIRNLVGPRLKLTERRRLLCYNHLKMIGHGALLYRTEYGRKAESLEELAKSECCPGQFGKGELVCPDGGEYRLSEDGLTGVCNHHGHAHALTPCAELELQTVTRAEAEAYQAFLNDYNLYWRTYFDPIVLKIQAQPERYRIETIVLPLIDNSIYTNLAAMLKGEPESLDRLPVPQRNILSLALHFNKPELLGMSGLQELIAAGEEEDEPADHEQLREASENLKLLGLAMFDYHDAHQKFPAIANFDKSSKKPLLSWRVHLLPFVDQYDLYRKFRLDEPWDSEHNKELIAQIPEVFRPENAKLAEAGETKLVAPVGKNTLFSSDGKEIELASVTDGLSNTIMLLESDDEHAVVWTKPEDLNVDLEKPRSGLQSRPPGGSLVLIADGSVHFFSESMTDETWKGLLTKNGGEVASVDERQELVMPASRNARDSRMMSYLEKQIDPQKLAAFLMRGIGNQVGLHVYDADPMFDFSLPQFLGRAIGAFSGRNRGWGFMGVDEVLVISAVVTSLNSPIYVSLPVNDADAVDAFLDELDNFLARQARQPTWQGFFAVSSDFYELPLADGTVARSYSFSLGPIKSRWFWARIADGLYVTSKPFILEDLAALRAEGPESQLGENEHPAHALVKLRPRHWNQVLSNYQLGWEENARQACLKNLGTVIGLGRGLTEAERDQPPEKVQTRLQQLSGEIFDSHYYCPDDGHYHLAEDGKSATCSIHGSASEPSQLNAPAAGSRAAELIRQFSGLTVSLTFLEDGLHAVVEVERKGNEPQE